MQIRRFENTIDFIVRVKIQDIAFLQSVMEGYEGSAGFTTVDPVQGIGRIFVAPFAFPVLKKVIEDLKKELGLEILEIIE
ncbi:DUF4911 domain-containing protein [Candidatus Riflebacteria bacterium]